MFGIGFQELFIILVIALVVLGPDKLPGLARAIGKGIGEFRKATDDLKSSFQDDDELREMHKNLSQAKADMADIVRKETKGLKAEEIAKSLADGDFFGNKKKEENQEADENIPAPPEDSPEKAAENKEPSTGGTEKST